MNKVIEIRVSPNHLYLTASQAAEHISQDILRGLPLLNRLRCYGRYLLEPAFIKEHLSSLMEDAPFFVGTVFQIWNYLSSTLETLEAVNATPPTKENLIRIISIPLKYAENHNIVITDGRYLPPSLQKVLKLLHQSNINLGEIDDNSIQYARQLLISTTQTMDIASSVGAAYGNHNKSKHLAFSHLKAGHKKEGFYYGEQACSQLSRGFSMEETLLTCDAMLEHRNHAESPEEYGILEIKAHIKFMFGEYKVALEIYESLTTSDILSTRYEAMRKVVRCHERLGKYTVAIGKGTAFLAQIDDDYYRAKIRRILGWTYIQLGETADLEEALKISGMAEEYFKAGNSRDLRYNLARAYNNLGVAHEQLADKPSTDRNKELIAATSNHSKCKTIMHELGSLRWESASLLNLSVVQRKNNQLAISLKQASEAIRIKTWICDFDDLPICQYNIALTHIKAYFADKNLESIYHALENINQALEFRNQQGSSKRTSPLLCLKALCEIIQQPDTGQTETMKLLLTVTEYPEDDKIPLFHKTLATIHLLLQQSLPNTLNRVQEELELPRPDNILEYIS